MLGGLDDLLHLLVGMVIVFGMLFCIIRLHATFSRGNKSLWDQVTLLPPLPPLSSSWS